MRLRGFAKCRAGRGSERGFTEFWEVEGSGDAVQLVRVEVSGTDGVGILGCECANDDEGS